MIFKFINPFSCSLLLAGGFFITKSNALLLLPKPTGGYNTTMSALKLTDNSRIDPFSPNSAHRAVMISAFSPVKTTCTPSTILSSPNKTAAFEDNVFNAQYGIPLGTFEQFALEICEPASQPSHPVKGDTQYPVLLFSGALGTSRLFYNTIAQSVASHGYIVITIDHPYDADIVEFPDGSTILQGNITTDEQVELSVKTRAEDISFVMDQLSNASVVTQLFPGRKSVVHVQKAGVFGHSLGGATAGEALLRDSRLVAGINFDGTMFGPVVQEGLNRPFILFGHENKTRAVDSDYTWAAIWPKLTGWKREFELKGSEHYTFSDVPDFASLLGLNGNSSDILAPIIGMIDSSRALDVITDYTTAFFDKFLRGVDTGNDLLNGRSCEYPEVSIVP
jgi:pimeloyl-ACP methyl ester carboxylesterase